MEAVDELEAERDQESDEQQYEGRIAGHRRAGRIEIVYTSAEDLERLTELITGRRG